MPKLFVKDSGKSQQEINLVPGNEYLVGRSESCQVRLKEDKSFSRQHFKIFQNEAGWAIEVLSQFGNVKINGQEIALYSLSSPTNIELGTYEFLFIDQKEQTEPLKMALQTISQDSDQLAEPMVNAANDEKTLVAVGSTTFGLISQLDAQGTTTRQLQVTSTAIIAGRDPSADLLIENPHVSRKQFQLMMSGGDYFLIDLGSSIPTMLNGYNIPKNKPVKITSGDEISVLEFRFYFEVHDAQFQSKIKSVVPFEETSIKAPDEDDDSDELPQLAYKGLIKKKFKLNPVRIALLALFFIGGVGFILDQLSPKSQPIEKKPKTPFERLKPEERRLIMHSYEIAQLSAAQGNFQTTLDELAKIHRTLPDGYQDSQRLKADVEAQLEYVTELKRLEEAKKEKEQRETRIQALSKKCQEYITQTQMTIIMQNLDECLAEAISEDPTHPAIALLRARVQKIEDDRAMFAQQQKEYEENVAKLERLFDKARKTSQKDPLLGIIELEKVARVELPDPRDRRGEARRMVASIKDKINSQINTALIESKRYEDKGDFKNAIIVLEKAAKVAPENQQLPTETDRLRNEIKKKMQPIYQESIVEENFGNLDSAKDRWKKIIKEDVQNGEYFQKAKMKLKKHGAL